MSKIHAEKRKGGAQMGLKEKFEWLKSGGKSINTSVIEGNFKPRAQTGLAVALSLILALCFFLSVITPLVKAADPGHPASSISSGTFESGDYTFPSNLTVNKFLIVNGTTLYVDAINGRLGVGIVPTQKLTVAGSIGIQAGANAFIGTLDNYNLSIRTNNADVIYITNTGNVGIGTTTPSSTLEVNGNVELTNLYDNDGSNFFDLSGCGDNTYVSSIDSTGAVICAAESGDIAGITTSATSGLIGGCTSGTCTLSLNSSIGGDGLSYTNGVLAINTLAGGGIVTSSDSLSLNRSCSANQILKWSGSNWYCAADDNSGGTMSSWNIAGDTGSDSVTNGQTVTIAGGTNGIDTSESGRTVTISLDWSEVGNDAISEAKIDFDTSCGPTSKLYVSGNDLACGTDATDDTVSGSELDGVFSTTGLLKRTGAATYTTITDNSDNWNAAYTHSTATSNVHGLTFTGEGSGGGLDADTVDGQHYSSNWPTTLANIQSATSNDFHNIGGTDYTCSNTGCTIGSDDTLSGPSVGANLNMNNYLIENIGNTGTDFTSGGGLTLAGTLSVTGSGTHSIAGNTNFASNTLYIDATNQRVGIGTTAPGAKLDVPATSGNIAGFGNLLINDQWASGVTFDGRTYDYKQAIYARGTGGACKMVYNSATDRAGWVCDGPIMSPEDGAYFAGNVGIGTTAPGYKLDINGTVHIAGVNKLNFDTIPGGHAAYLGNTDATLGNFKITGAMGTDDYWTIFGDGATNAGVMHIRTGDDGTEPIYFEQNTNVRMAIDSFGNVGIGTTSPGKKLDVAGGTIRTIGAENKYVQLMTDEFPNTTNTFVVGTRYGWYSDYWDVGAYRSDGTPISKLAFRLNDVDKMVIDTNGNVGIGTTSPGAKLDIFESSGVSIPNLKLTTTGADSSIIVFDNSAASGNRGNFLDFWENGTAKWQFGHQYSTALVNPGGITLYDYAASQYRLVITSSGNVGIGTTGPTDKLSINTSYGLISIGEVGGSVIRRGSGGGIVLNAGSSGGIVYINRDVAGDFAVESNGVDIMRVTNSGKVGIGTTSPNNILDIVTGTSGTYGNYAQIRTSGSVGFQGGLLITNAPSTTAGYSSLKITSSYNSDSSATAKIGFVANNATETFLNSGPAIEMKYNGNVILAQGTGNIGIGTTPSYKLHVAGSFGFSPGSSVTPQNNGDIVIEATNNTTITFKLKGSDGTIRTATLTLS